MRTTKKNLRRKIDTTNIENIIGNNLSNSFFDSYESEGLECSDIIKRVDECDDKFITIIFEKNFLKKIVHSHLLFIKEMEKINIHS